MSVLVSTQFSQGRVFYAGETVTCRITFSNPLPILPVTPTTSSSASSYRRRASARNSSAYPSRLQTPIATSHASSPLAQSSKQFNGQHSRSQSLTSASDFASRKDRHSVAKSPSSHRRTGSTTIGHPVYEESQTNSNRKTSSFTDLASSTFAYFAGYSINGNHETKDDESDNLGKGTTENQDSDLHENKKEIPSTREDDQLSEISHPIAIELGSIEPDTPRSSIDTQSTYIAREPDSGRSSMDSTTSYATNPHSHNLGAHRLSLMMKSTSAPSLLHKTEHLLWGFAQVVGHFVADPAMINASEFSQLKTRTMYRPGGGFGGGGGMLGRPSGTRSQSRIDTNSIPVFSTPPSILFVDLDLLPGESKSYLYKLTLPKDIPPSHKGRCIRFNYHLVIGTQRSSSNNSSSANAGMGRGHVVHLPFRVLNHVSPDGTRPIYDLMNPVVVYQDEAKIEQVDTNERQLSKSTTLPPGETAEDSDKEREEFLSYVEELIASSSIPAAKRQNSSDSATTTGTLPSPPPNSEITRRVSEVYDEQAEQNKGEPKRSSYTSKNAMYEICKSNVRVAYLHLTKTMQRLGEPIMGVLNFKGSDIPTYHINITLESHEDIEQSIALKSQPQNKKITRRIHSEHHEFCLNTRRVAFSLPVPVTATPDFQTTGVKLQYFLRLEFLTGIQVIPDPSSPDHIEKQNVPSYLPINVDGRHKQYQAAQEVDVSSFDCTIPLKIYGASGGIDKGIYGWSSSFVVTE